MSETPSGPQNVLYYGDNLPVLREHVADESVNLIYLDPPFNSNADYNVLFAERDGTKAHAQFEAFGDTWTWDTEAAANFDDALRNGGEQVAKAMLAFKTLLGHSDMLAYLSMMAPRLVELRRVLKPTGSIYLHCDPTASHYLKLLLDSVFGPENFRSEIIWKRSSGHNKLTRQFGPVHDTLLFYAKSDKAFFRPGTRPLMRGYVREWFTDKDDQGVFRTNMLTGPGTRTGDSGSPWHGFDPTTVGRHWAIPSSLAEVLPAEANQWTTQEKLDFLHAKGCIYIPREGKGQPKYKQYIGSGIPYQDVWACQPYTEGTLYESDECIDADVKWLGHERERLGYPTQKPEGLLDRIIRSSSPDGALVLDPFCGCGTAVAVSQRLNRRWIGIDITHLAVNLIKVRLRDAFGPKVDETYRVVGEPTTAADAAQLAKEEPYQFQWWALGLVGARPATSDRKKGADRGIDGRLFFHDGSDSGGEAGDVKQVILSVKAGENLNVSMVRDLVGVLDREKDSGAALGVVISMEEPTKPMRQEAAGAGFYRSPAGTQHPRIQLLTVGELLAGKTIDMPPWRDVRTFKKAPKSKGKATSQTQLGFGGE